jgi:AmiR/NasT family two-component response regulator
MSPEPYPRSVADALGSFEHDRLLAELARVHEQIAHLDSGADSGRDISTAIAILMAQGRLTKEQAFERLRMASRDSHRKLGDIAAEVAKGGFLPSPQGAP